MQIHYFTWIFQYHTRIHEFTWFLPKFNTFFFMIFKNINLVFTTSYAIFSHAYMTYPMYAQIFNKTHSQYFSYKHCFTALLHLHEYNGETRKKQPKLRISFKYFTFRSHKIKTRNKALKMRRRKILSMFNLQLQVKKKLSLHSK